MEVVDDALGQLAGGVGKVVLVVVNIQEFHDGFPCVGI